MSSVSLKPVSEQVIVITGASSGIGLATAEAAAAAAENPTRAIKVGAMAKVNTAASKWMPGSAPRASVLRTWCVSHLVHHRAQLCVYLRILGVPVPAVYFNSADEPEWVFA